MKKLILCYFMFHISPFSFGQNYEPHEEISKYPNGRIMQKGVIVITSPKPEVIDSMAVYTYTSKPIGLWEYWYENGNKKLEIFWDDKKKCINMWFSDGTQILKNGNGYYSSHKNEATYDNYANEKVVFIVKDSIVTDKMELLRNPPYVK